MTPTCHSMIIWPLVNTISLNIWIGICSLVINYNQVESCLLKYSTVLLYSLDAGVPECQIIWWGQIYTLSIGI